MAKKSTVNGQGHSKYLLVGVVALKDSINSPERDRKIKEGAILHATKYIVSVSPHVQ